VRRADRDPAQAGAVPAFLVTPALSPDAAAVPPAAKDLN
jgi:hypothetical protein